MGCPPFRPLLLQEALSLGEGEGVAVPRRTMRHGRPRLPSSVPKLPQLPLNTLLSFTATATITELLAAGAATQDRLFSALLEEEVGTTMREGVTPLPKLLRQWE